jgi:GT2 family glycosyltransferase
MNKESPLVSIVIPTYNKRTLVEELVRSILNSDITDYEIIVVDNASPDNTSEYLQGLFQNLRIIKLERNTGVTGGRNAGALEARGRYILFLDHDLTIDRKCISFLLDSAQKQEVGAAGPIVYYYADPKRIWAAGTSIKPVSGRVVFNYPKMIDDGRLDSPFEVQILPAAFMVPKDVIDKVGLFDNTFFATFEDSDFCFRILKAGYKILCDPRAKAWHNTPVFSKDQAKYVLNRAYFVSRNRIIFMKKYSSKLNFIIFSSIYVPIYFLFYSLSAIRNHELGAIIKYLKGIVDGHKFRIA